MIIDFIIALVVYDSIKFIFSIAVVIFNKDKSKKEIEIRKKVKTFEERIRDKMDAKDQ